MVLSYIATWNFNICNDKSRETQWVLSHKLANILSSKWKHKLDKYSNRSYLFKPHDHGTYACEQVQVGQGKSAVQLSIQVAPHGKRGEVELNCVRNEAEDGGTGYTVSVNRYTLI